MRGDGDNLFTISLIVASGAFVAIASFIGITMYIYNKLVLQKKIHQEAQVNHQKELVAAVLQSQENERRRIGMDLHDEVGSPLSLIRMLVGNISTDRTEFYLNKCKSLIDHIVSSVRRISHNLSPLVEGVYQLTDALEDLRDSVNDAGTIRFALNLPDETLLNEKLNHQLSLVLYRVLAELVNNSLKHSHANMIILDMELLPTGLKMSYRDNGTGLPENVKNGNGLKNIESRLTMIGAKYDLDKQHQGFKITINLII